MITRARKTEQSYIYQIFSNFHRKDLELKRAWTQAQRPESNLRLEVNKSLIFGKAQSMFKAW